MDKTIKRRFPWPSKRRVVQLYAALLYNAHLKGFVTGEIYTGNAKALCVPGLNCYSCPGAVGACPLGALQNALAASRHTTGWYVFGMLLLFGLTLGRTVCGWLCPMGLLQELMHKLPTPKIKKNRFTHALSFLKYGILVAFVIAWPLYYAVAHDVPLPAFCKYICPAGTLEGAVALLSNLKNDGLFAQLGLLFTRKFVILLAIGLACVFCYRSFCRFLCPLGAIYGLFNRIALTGVKADAEKCTGCGACVHGCPMDVRQVGDHECISCGKCISSCAQGAISLRCGKLTLQGPKAAADAQEKKKAPGFFLWSVLVLLLTAALLYFNVFDPSSQKTASPAAENESAIEAPFTQEEPVQDNPSAQDVLIGYEPGQRLADFSCLLTDGTPFYLADTKGKIVFINQWATYCTPCVEELPYFERLQEERPDIVILAVHHWLEASPEAMPYIVSKGWDQWQIKFTVDTMDAPILTAINGNNTMPRTVVLNREGIVVYNEQRSVTYDMLLSLVEKAEQ